MTFDQLMITQKGFSTVGLEEECKSSLSKLAVVEPVETTFDSSNVIFESANTLFENSNTETCFI
jgi:hypothetical protein